MHRSPPRFARALPGILLPLLALVVVAPLIAHGCSCGHDFEFHLQSWLDAAAQMRHGTFDPAWTITAAWNAGEPRFLFYPPLSWVFGALLALTMPLAATPIVFTAVAVLGAGIAMYLLASDYASSAVATLAAAIYMATPYMLFTAFERTAYGELLAAAWIPLLLRAALRERPSIAGLAVPTALLWLTNAPAAVIGIYTLALIAILRIALALYRRSIATARILLVRFSAGGVLGLALAACYLVPASYERRYVQVAMALIPNMRIEDNFLFGYTGGGPHDQVLHAASVIAVSMLIASFVALAFAFALQHKNRRTNTNDGSTTPLLILAALTLCIAFLLTPWSLQLWRHLPELAFLQFPWRMLCVLGATLALAVAMALRFILSTRVSLATTTIVALVFVASMTTWKISAFRQPCEDLDLPSVRAQLFSSHHGVEPTDEYTPTEADNGFLRWDDPDHWLASNPAAFAPGTVPNPAAIIVDYDVAPPVDQTVSGIAPRRLQLDLSQPKILVLNLRDYPTWQVFRNGTLITQHLRRSDGLLAVALPAGTSVVDIRWHRTWDQLLGDLISLFAIVVLGALLLRSRTIKPDA